jgi:phosphopantothenate synthetase
MIMAVKKFKDLEQEQREMVMKRIVKEFNNHKNLLESLSIMQGNIA